MDVKDLRPIIGQRLRDLRQSRGWTQGEVAQQAHVSRDFICRCEGGSREPSMHVLAKLAGVFDVPPVLLLTPMVEKSRPLIREIEALLVNRSDDEVRWVRDVVRVLLRVPAVSDQSSEAKITESQPVAPSEPPPTKPRKKKR